MPKNTANTSPAANSAEDLINEFALETEVKNPAQGNAHDFEEPEPEPNNPQDFIPDPEPTVPEEPETIHTPGDLLRPGSQLSLETQATLLVGTFDNIQQMILKAIHTWKLNKKLGDKVEVQRIRELIDELEANTKQLDELDLPDRAKIRIVERVGKKISELPFTDQEYDQLEETVRLILKDMPNYQLSPGAGLTLAAITVMAPRIVDVIVD